MNRRSLGSAVLICLFGASLTAACSSSKSSSSGSSSASSNASPITIGVVSSLTGAYSFVGTDGGNGLKMAADSINAAGGIGGRQVKLEVEDDASTPAQAIPLINKFAADKSILFTLYVGGSAVAVPAAGVANQQKIFMGAVGGTSDKIRASGEWSMSMSASLSDLMEPLAKYAAARGDKNIATVTASDNAATVSATALFDQFAKAGGTTIGTSANVASTDQNLSAVVSKVAGSKPGGTYLSILPAQAATYIAQYNQTQGPGQHFYGPTALAAVSFLTAGGAAINGTVVAANFDPNGTAAAKQFASAYKSRFDVQASDYSAIGYASLEYIAARLAKAPKNVTRQDVQKLLTAAGSQSSVLGEGTSTTDDKGIVNYPGALLEAQNGAFVSAPKL